MRTLDLDKRERRKRLVLEMVVSEFIKTARPVGSLFLSGEFSEDLSPATIRKLLADLESEGFLTHPHTSAGRIPTDEGYRFYVELLVESGFEPARTDQYGLKTAETDKFLRAIPQLLSDESGYAGFVLLPGTKDSRLGHFELIRLDRRRVLAILMMESGLIHHRLITFPEEAAGRVVHALSIELNRVLHGRTLGDIANSVSRATGHGSALKGLALDVMRQASDIQDEERLHLDGMEKVLTMPDFEDLEGVLEHLRVLADRRLLRRLLEDETRDAMVHDDVRVRIGGENASPFFRSLSLVTASFGEGPSRGVLGLIGPKRMFYSHAIKLVGRMQATVNEALRALRERREPDFEYETDAPVAALPDKTGSHYS